MKIYFSLVLVTILAAFGSGYYIFSLKSHYTATDDDQAQIGFLKREFIFNTPNLVELDLSDQYPSNKYLELIKPIKSLDNSLTNLDKKIFYTPIDCFKHLSNLLDPGSLGKTLIWEEYRCGVLKKLPQNFFEVYPFLHPSGSSFAYLYYKFQKMKLDQVVEYLPFFHLFELSEVKKDLGSLPFAYEVLSDLDVQSLEALSSKEDILLTKNYILFIKWDVLSFYHFKYIVYSRDIFESFIARNNFVISPLRSNSNCLYKDGQLCWNYSVGRMLSLISLSQSFIFIMFVILILILVWAIFTKLKNDKLSDEKRKLALRILTHELRTPIASALIRIEQLAQKSSGLDEEMQLDLVSLSGDIHRLHRLSEMSRSYLSVNYSGRKLNLKKVKIKSLNAFIEDIVNGYDQVDLVFLENDASFRTDEYCLGICIKNLIDNSLEHGRAPVTVRLEKISNVFSIEVEDSGECEYSNIEDMTKEFVKGSASKGTGLGLNIVLELLKDLSGKLTFQPKPSRFKILIREMSEDKNVF